MVEEQLLFLPWAVVHKTTSNHEPVSVHGTSAGLLPKQVQVDLGDLDESLGKVLVVLRVVGPFPIHSMEHKREFEGSPLVLAEPGERHSSHLDL